MLEYGRCAEPENRIVQAVFKVRSDTSICNGLEKKCAATKKSPAAKATGDHFWHGQKDLNPRHMVLEWLWKDEKLHK